MFKVKDGLRVGAVDVIDSTGKLLTLAANSALLNGKPESYYTNAANLTGALPLASAPVAITSKLDTITSYATSGDNMIPNADFQEGTLNWTIPASDGVVAVAAPVVKNGRNYMSVSAIGNALPGRTFYSGYMPIGAGTTGVGTSIDFWIEGVTKAQMEASYAAYGWGVYAYDSNKSMIGGGVPIAGLSYGYLWYFTQPPVALATATNPFRVNASALTLPSGTAFLRFFVFANIKDGNADATNVSPGATIYFGQPRITRLKDFVTEVAGAGKPDDYAGLNDNLLANGLFNKGADGLDGWVTAVGSFTSTKTNDSIAPVVTALTTTTDSRLYGQKNLYVPGNIRSQKFFLDFWYYGPNNATWQIYMNASTADSNYAGAQPNFFASCNGGWQYFSGYFTTSATTAYLSAPVIISALNGATGTMMLGAVRIGQTNINAGSVGQYWRGDQSWATLDKTAVGLANVDNTSDLNKPISNAVSTALLATSNAANLTSGTLSAGRLPAFSGDISTTVGTSVTALATVNSNVGSFGGSNQIATFTVNGKGLITAAANVAVTATAIGAQPSDATLTALAALNWSSGTQVLTLTGADTFTLQPTGTATANNILTKAGGDSLYLPIGSSWAPVSATGTGSLQNITLPESGLAPKDVLLTIEGMVQDIDQYSISGTTLTIAAGVAPATSDITVRKLNAGIATVSSTLKRTVFTANGTWTKDPAAKLVRVTMWGGGGGGAGGGCVVSGTQASGGGGGGGGAYVTKMFPANSLGSTESVFVGNGGGGGAGRSTAGTGSNGGNGGTSRFGSGSGWLNAFGGGGGTGGGTSASIGGAGGGPLGAATLNSAGFGGGSATATNGFGGAGAGGSSTGAGSAGGTGVAAENAGAGGAGGGGIFNATTSQAGGFGGQSGGPFNPTVAGQGAAGGGAGGTLAVNTTYSYGGFGGGGGGGATSSAAGAGGDGQQPGGGAGGGGASLVGFLSGTGGAGGAGMVVIEEFF